MLKIGIIGAGAISNQHLTYYFENSDCEVVAISDINYDRAKLMADKFGIQNIYTDYHDILNDKTIDAVSIATPTFTHKEIALDAIKSHKHILCEKPPALNADEVKEICDALKGYDKVFMFAMVCRFRNQVQYMKNYVESGKMGKIICAEAVRTNLMSKKNGWFANRKLGGGSLRDEAVHELDLVLYIMGYPKATKVTAFESHLQNDLAHKIKGIGAGYKSADTNTYQNNTEDIIKGFITLDNGVNLIVKSGSVNLSHKRGAYTEINGEKAGAVMEGPLKLYEVTDDLYIQETIPLIDDNNCFADEIRHFLDCCANNTECIVKHDEAVTLMEIIDAMYKSAETGETITL